MIPPHHPHEQFGHQVEVVRRERGEELGVVPGADRVGLRVGVGPGVGELLVAMVTDSKPVVRACWRQRIVDERPRARQNSWSEDARLGKQWNRCGG